MIAIIGRSVGDEVIGHPVIMEGLQNVIDPSTFATRRYVRTAGLRMDRRPERKALEPPLFVHARDR